MLTRPFKPYILRHTSINEKRHIIGDSDLRDAADWSKTSSMPKRYWHFGRSSSIPALERTQGIFAIDGNGNGKESGDQIALKPNLICYHCREPNKRDAKFCANPKCGFVLSFEAHTETIKAAEETKKRVADLEEKVESLRKLALKQSFRVIEKEVESNPLPPYIEDATNKTPLELLHELKERGYTTFAFEKEK
jgi:hypothetical protein